MEILLYESYALAKKQAFARTKDTDRTLVITLAAGKGVIVDAYATDETGTTVTKLAEGRGVGLYATIRNDGDPDHLWVTAKDIDTGAIIVREDGMPCDMETPGIIASGGSITFALSGYYPPLLHMPNKTWNILIEAGHGKK